MNSAGEKHYPKTSILFQIFVYMDSVHLQVTAKNFKVKLFFEALKSRLIPLEWNMNIRNGSQRTN